MNMNSSEKKDNLHIWLSLSLRAGVFVAFILVVIGLIMFFISEDIIIDRTLPLNEFFGKITDFNNVILVSLGVLILLFTPIIQIIIAAVKFAFDRDKLFLGICFILLCILSINIILSII